MKHPKRIDFITLCRALPQIAVQFATVVPAEFWTVDGDVAKVRCPCGYAPALPRMVPAGCACTRFFLYDGTKVRVARYETTTA